MRQSRPTLMIICCALPTLGQEPLQSYSRNQDPFANSDGGELARTRSFVCGGTTYAQYLRGFGDGECLSCFG